MGEIDFRAGGGPCGLRKAAALVSILAALFLASCGGGQGDQLQEDAGQGGGTTTMQGGGTTTMQSGGTTIMQGDTTMGQ